MPVADAVPREVRLLPGILPDGRIGILKLLLISGLASSESEAHRLIAAGEVAFDGRSLSDPEAKLTLADGAVLSAGRMRARVRL